MLEDRDPATISQGDATLPDSLTCLESIVSLREIETAVSGLPADELSAFARWFEAFVADEWDRRIEADIAAGRLDEAGRQADADFDAGRCKPL